jgi:hypothetical protein
VIRHQVGKNLRARFLKMLWLIHGCAVGLSLGVGFGEFA